VLSQATRWSIANVPMNDRTDAWQHVLSNSYRDWQVPTRLPSTFRAEVSQHDFAGAGLVETICDPCNGQRNRAQIRRDDDLYIGVQLTTKGRERFKIDNARVEVAAGDLVVWRTDEAVEFEVIQRLHKVTLMVAWSMVRDRMPERNQPPAGGKIDSRSGVGSLLATHLLALSNQIASLDSREQGSVSRSTLELLGIALSGQQSTASFDAGAAMTARVQDYILQHLHDEWLNPAAIAAANHMSLRYLHMLFHHADATVSGWIQERRLLQCRETLTDSAFSHLGVADIGYRWGFNSASHFSRAFKDRFGESPGAVRQRATMKKFEH
jgi:AraC-like DNA-binding protein